MSEATLTRAEQRVIDAMHDGWTLSISYRVGLARPRVALTKGCEEFQVLRKTFRSLILKGALEWVDIGTWGTRYEAKVSP